MNLLTEKKLEKLLKEAEIEHGKYEKILGKRDENWPTWYAHFIFQKLEKEKKLDI